MRGKLKDCSGKISILEMILIVLIVCMTGFIVSKGVDWTRKQAAHSNDTLLANTAESAAKINSSNGLDCVVQDCPSKSGSVCTHVYNTNGATIGYLDKVSKHIVGTKPYGYNEDTEMDINGTAYYGDVNTMVLQVIAEGNNISVSWVPGRTQ